MSKSGSLPATSRAARRAPPARVRIKGIQGNVVSFASPGSANEVWRKELKLALGTVSDAFVDMTLHQLERAARMPDDGASDLAINGALAIISAYAPRDEAQAALAVQVACTHMVVMVIMGRIGGGHGGDRRLPGLASAAAKLLRAHCTQADTYRRQRGGGDQNIRVEHVHVHEAGQAIVGAVSSLAREVER
jgi:hypothetical protein